MPPQYVSGPCKLTFDLLTLKVVSDSRVTWATAVPILVFLGLSVLDLGPMYATDRRQTRIIVIYKSEAVYSSAMNIFSILDCIHYSLQKQGK